MKKRVLSGIRATGRLHLGNYLGALKGMLALAEGPRAKGQGLRAEAKYETLYMIADLHTMTTPYSPDGLRRHRLEVAMDYLAAGLDPDKSIIFTQSDLADLHAQLMFYFSTVVSVARMQHLPTFKDKVKQYPKNVTMALLNYPVLMAADILIYKASVVPVGIDQEPHLEIAREVARKMNEIYGTDFPEPQRFETEAPYVPSLLGEGKMSKSVEGSYINLTDSLAEIHRKLAGVPTDSGKGQVKEQKTENKKQQSDSRFRSYISEGKESAGVGALMEFVEMFQGVAKRQLYEDLYTGGGIRYSQLKAELAEAIYQELAPMQARRQEYEQNPPLVTKILQDGARRAREVAENTLKEVRQKMGLP